MPCQHLILKVTLDMAYLNYTAQDFASRLESRRPGRGTPESMLRKATHAPCQQVFFILSLFSAMQNFYTCILHGNHYNYGTIICSDILISHKRMKLINIHMHRILNQNLGNNSSIIAIFTYIHRIHAKILLKSHKN